jgi:hypothetical protein
MDAGPVGVSASSDMRLLFVEATILDRAAAILDMNSFSSLSAEKTLLPNGRS